MPAVPGRHGRHLIHHFRLKEICKDISAMWRDQCDISLQGCQNVAFGSTASMAELPESLELQVPPVESETRVGHRQAICVLTSPPVTCPAPPPPPPHTSEPLWQQNRRFSGRREKSLGFWVHVMFACGENCVCMGGETEEACLDYISPGLS